MSWNQMGSNQGLPGLVANDMPNQPNATEYTLQGRHRCHNVYTIHDRD